MSGQMSILIYVQKSPKCLELAKYIKANIAQIKPYFESFQMIKITDKAHAKKLGIEVIPTMRVITAEGGMNNYSGVEKIKETLKEFATSNKQVKPSAAPKKQSQSQFDEEFSDNYILGVACEGVKREGDRLVVVDDEGSSRDAEFDLRRKEYEKAVKSKKPEKRPNYHFAEPEDTPKSQKQQQQQASYSRKPSPLRQEDDDFDGIVEDISKDHDAEEEIDEYNRDMLQDNEADEKV